MRILTILLLLLLASPVFGELTKADLHDLKEDLHKVIKEEITASEKRTREYIDLKTETTNTRIDALDGRIGKLEESLSSRIGDMWRVVLVLIGFVAATIAIPQIIIARTEKRRQKDIEREHQDLQTEIEHLRGRLEALENTPS